MRSLSSTLRRFRRSNAKSTRSRRNQLRRRLRSETLEGRRVLALVGVEPLLMAPIINYDNGGTASYDASTDVFNIDATPIDYDAGAGAFLNFPPLFGPPTFDVNVVVDDAGNLVGGVPGDDLVLTGDLDLNLDFNPEFSGVLLTGEVTDFGFDEQGITDRFDFRFTITGGALAGEYVGKDLGVTLDLENSTFADDFTVSFGGSPAKGKIGGLDPVSDPADPGIDIEKSTNGQDADVATGPQVLVGDTVDFEYVVTNTGNVPLDNVTVTDDQGVTVTFQGGDTNNDSLLDVDETWVFVGSTIAVAGQYTNIGSVSGTDATGEVSDPVTDADPSNHVGVVADIAVQKFVDKVVTTEQAVHLDFEGLAAGTIVDTQFPGVTIEAENRRNPSAGNQAMIFDSSAPTGNDLDLGTPNQDFGGPGVGTGGGQFGDYPNDTALGNILIISEDGDASDPDDEAQGGVFTFTFDEPVRVDYLELLDIDSNEAGGSVISVTTASGNQTVSIPAVGNNSFQRVAIDVDDVTSMTVDFVSSGAITELKFTEFSSEKVWFDANEAPGPEFNLGETIEFSYHVTNPGDISIFPVNLIDDNATPSDTNDDFDPTFVSGDDDNDGELDPGEEWIYTATITATTVGQFTNIAEVTGEPVGFPGREVSDNDPGNYTVLGVSDIEIQKFTNGVDADDPDGADVPEIAAGDTVSWTYEVTNTGDNPFDISEVTVIDDGGTPSNTSDDFSPSLVTSSDVGGDGVLSPGETWTFTASDTAQLLGTSTGESTTFHLTGNSDLDGPDGNILSFTADGITVNTSAFSRDSSGTWETAFLGSFSQGLGVTDTSEGDGTGSRHRVDNIHRQNYVLFEFSESVVIDSTFLDSVRNDSDITAWIGTIPNAFSQHVSLNDAVLADLVSETNNTSRSTSRWADLNDGEAVGNVLVIAASISDATPEDQFKIRKVKVEQIGGGVYTNIGTVSTGSDGPSDSDPSSYRNPAPVDSGQIGNFVWNDINMNGQQDSGESGIGGVTVRLLDASGNEVATTTTDTDGMYSFDGLPAGDYKVEFVAPQNFVFSPQYRGDDADSGSNADPDTGLTDLIHLDAHEIDNTIDAGLYESAVDVMFEAEDGQFNHPWEIFHSSSASGGEFIKAPNGTGSHYNDVPSGKSVNYDFSVSETGVYGLSGLVKAVSSRDNSLWVKVNDQPWVQWHMDTTGSAFQWQGITDGWDQEAVTFDLNAGQNHLEIKVREDGTKIDKFMVSKVEFSTVIFSANDYVSATGDWIVDVDEDGNESLVAGGRNNWSAPSVGDTLTYEFEISEAGTYQVFGHVSAASGSDNSFWVRIDGGEWVQWHLTVTGEGNWEWQVVTHGSEQETVTFDLSEGTHTMEVAIRENGTMVDLWAVSNDVNFNG